MHIAIKHLEHACFREGIASDAKVHGRYLEIISDKGNQSL